jgi:tetratricopeptide (TPR) repeat protein
MFKQHCYTLIIFIISLNTLCKAQTNEADSINKLSEEQYISGDYEKALIGFEQLIEDNPDSSYHYGASQSSGRLGLRDKSYYHLTKGIEKDSAFIAYYFIKHEHAYDKFRHKREWKTLLAEQKIVNRNYERINCYNSDLRKKLAEIQESDQRHLLKLFRLIKENNNKMSVRGFVLVIRQLILKKRNIRSIEKIIMKHGYPGKSLVGNKMSSIAFLVVQHSNQKTMEKLLPILQKAADNGELPKSSLALLIDRIKMKNGEKQIYGTQIADNENGESALYPVENYETINVRRKEMGMEPIEDYLESMKVLMGVEIVISNEMNNETMD